MQIDTETLELKDCSFDQVAEKVDYKIPNKLIIGSLKCLSSDDDDLDRQFAKAYEEYNLFIYQHKTEIMQHIFCAF